MKIKLMLAVCLLFLSADQIFSQNKTLNLSGSWNFKLDPNDNGEKENWSMGQFSETIQLPGTTDEGHKGTKTIGPDYGILSREYKYVGPAWYSREINVPSKWKGKDIELFLERVMWESKVWIDGKLLTKEDALAVPHLHRLGKLSPGKHIITIRINNDLIYNIGDKGHVYTEYTQSIWNGAVGKIELRAKENMQIYDMQLFPDADKKELEVKLKLRNPVASKIVYSITDLQTGEKVVTTKKTLSNIEEQTQKLEMNFPIKLWDEFTPNRYRITAEVANGGEQSADFGFRSVSTSASKILINKAPVFMRGNLDCVHFPLTGYPSCDVKEWERIFKIYKSYGLNHVRFHSWCPPEAAFEAADKLGIYIQAETIWIDYWMTSTPKDRPDMLTKGLPEGLGKNPSADKFVQEELQRILDAYGNHPSFVMLCIGNELGNSNFDVMQQWIKKLKEKDSRRLYSVSTARKITPVDDFSVTHNIPGVGGTYGIQGASTDYDLEKNYSKSTIPIIAHEVGQFPVYPLWSEIDKYKGVLKARNLEKCKESAVSNGLVNKDADFHAASGAQQRELYKALIENFYRTKSCAGFEMLSMQDYQGQGEALVGWLDAFYDDKGTTSPEYFRQYSNVIVPLARFKKFVWENKERFKATIQIANYSSADLINDVEWELIATDGKSIGKGEIQKASIKRGELQTIEEIDMPLNAIQQATEAKLKINIPGTSYHNEWTVWIYPSSLPDETSPKVFETNKIDDKTIAALQKGETVVLYAAKLGKQESFRPLFFEPLFWSNIFFPGQENTTLGLSVNEKHPAFKNFPSAFYGDWQWEAISKGRAFKLDNWPAAIEPFAQPISDFHINEKLGSLFECRVGKGRLLVCGYDIEDNKNVVAKQLRYSLLKYVSSSDFNPTSTVELSLLQSTFPLIKEAQSKVPVPEEFANALLYVKAGINVPKETGEYPWKKEMDVSVLKRKMQYNFKNNENPSIWRWDDKAAWFAKEIEIEINVPQGVIGDLYVHFSDWNKENREAKILLEGRESVTGVLDQKGKWVKLFVMREDTNDGKLILRTNSLAGSNVMIDQLIFVENK
ncbi:glycosyl hydrolase family 2 [Flavobacterium cutihirudinis]|uniref:Glycosyl hydrolase family 2 n=1 Tax=Flavobacterium cutihirudinis TaxID=1265740 RepID=A0A3D9FTH1_9FLAO|nr:sugar-binding domain-containing protein [Flavobacterium cutihirudinis]RED23866.1 glycosyl hydrolase family 2 [Flavobacterium cutihirudinis]